MKKIKQFPRKKYKIIYLDPPWQYTSDPNGNRGLWALAQDHYRTMSFDELAALRIERLAHKNCILFMWVTSPLLYEGLELLKVWGFDYKTIAFVWVKKTKSNKDYMGLGWYTRQNAEICLVARRGKFSRKSNSVKQVVEYSVNDHSEKPKIFHDKIVELCGNLPRIELFARSKANGWDHWGNEI